MLALLSCRFSGRNNPDEAITFSIAVADNQNAERETQAQHEKTILVLRMIRIEKSQRMVVQKYRLRLLKRDTVLSNIVSIFLLIPLKPNTSHAYSVHISGAWFNP